MARTPFAPAVQQKIMDALLKKPENNYCSDCGGKSPCWASLDFGVFVCMNCSGAHRALGPTITRIKSIKLDAWNADWLANMQIGNTLINEYWEKQLNCMPANTKPNVNSSLNQIKKYVVDKYVKRKFVDEKQGEDPLTLMKKGLWQPPTKKEEKKQQMIPEKDVSTKVIPTVTPIKILPQINKGPNKKLQQQKQKQVDLLNFGVVSSTHNPINIQPKSKINQDKINSTQLKKQENFLEESSNQSDHSSTQKQTGQQLPPYNNFFMSPQGFVNSTAQNCQPHNNQHNHSNHFFPQNTSQPINIHQHGYSVPSSHTNPQQPQILTMNINMNMYPNVMNINMGNYQQPNNGNNYLGQPQIQQHSNNAYLHSTHGNIPKYQYNDFFTANIPPPPKAQQNTGITLDITLDNSNKKPLENKQKSTNSWVDQWM